MEKYPLIRLMQDSQGYWFGRIKGSFDRHGNELECRKETPKEVVECLLEQWDESIEFNKHL